MRAGGGAASVTVVLARRMNARPLDDAAALDETARADGRAAVVTGARGRHVLVGSIRTSDGSCSRPAAPSHRCSRAATTASVPLRHSGRPILAR